MGRRTIPVDRENLVQAIAQVEGNTGVQGGVTELAKKVAKMYNQMFHPETPVTHSVVGLRIRDWELPIKTQRAKRKRGPLSAEQKAAMKKGRAQNRQTKEEKFKASSVAQENFKQIRKNTPPRFHPIVDLIEKGSRTAAVKLNCLDCSGWVTSEVRKCECTHCALYLFRPYQGPLEADEDPDQDDQDEHEAA